MSSCRSARTWCARIVSMAAAWGIAMGAAAQVKHDPHHRSATVVITQALAVASAADQFPADAAAQTVSLPNDWSPIWPAHAGSVWYRVQFKAPSVPEGDKLALFVERACTTLEVYLNGERVFTGGRMAEPTTHGCYRSVLITLPRAQLDAANNQLDLRVMGLALERVAARQRAAGLSVLRIGPESELAPAHRMQMLRDITSAQITGALLLVLGGLALGMRWASRRDAHLLYFGLLLIGWALWSARLWVRDWPLSTAYAEWLLASALPLLLACAVLFMLRWVALRHPVIEAALLAQCLVMPATLTLAGPDRLFALASTWYVLLAIELVLALGVFLWTARQRWRGAFLVLSLPVAATAGLVAAGVAGQLQLVPMWRMNLLQLVLPVILVAICARLVQLFTRALRAAEAGRSTLESRVQEVSAEIERNFAQLAELRVEQVTQKERKRIAADLHDDLGAKLLTIVHTSDDDRISSLAREALEEMRLSVRGLTGKPMRLADALADWRAEVVARLGQAGIEADWRSPSEEGEHLLSARAYVQATRILREAVSNIIKHSSASHCKVRCTIGENDFRITIQDNGNGIPLELDGRLDRGHGMASMKHRAKQLQGQCLVESGPGYGTVIRLTLPL